MYKSLLHKSNKLKPGIDKRHLDSREAVHEESLATMMQFESLLMNSIVA